MNPAATPSLPQQLAADLTQTWAQKCAEQRLRKSAFVPPYLWGMGGGALLGGGLGSWTYKPTPLQEDASDEEKQQHAQQNKRRKTMQTLSSAALGGGLGGLLLAPQWDLFNLYNQQRTENPLNDLKEQLHLLKQYNPYKFHQIKQQAPEQVSALVGKGPAWDVVSGTLLSFFRPSTLLGGYVTIPRTGAPDETVHVPGVLTSPYALSPAAIALSWDLLNSTLSDVAEKSNVGRPQPPTWNYRSFLRGYQLLEPYLRPASVQVDISHLPERQAEAVRQIRYMLSSLGDDKAEEVFNSLKRLSNRLMQLEQPTRSFGPSMSAFRHWMKRLDKPQSLKSPVSPSVYQAVLRKIQDVADRPSAVWYLLQHPQAQRWLGGQRLQSMIDKPIKTWPFMMKFLPYLMEGTTMSRGFLRVSPFVWPLLLAGGALGFGHSTLGHYELRRRLSEAFEETRKRMSSQSSWGP